MTETVHKTIELENGHTLAIMDVSRKIGADAFLVKMKAAMEIAVTDRIFTRPLPEGLTPDRIQAVLGDRVTYEYEVERNFIMDHEKEAVFQALVDTYLANLAPYVGKPVFPEKFILKTYQDRTG